MAQLVESGQTFALTDLTFLEMSILGAVLDAAARDFADPQVALLPGLETETGVAVAGLDSVLSQFVAVRVAACAGR